MAQKFWSRSLAALVTSLLASSSWAQELPDIGFTSAGQPGAGAPPAPRQVGNTQQNWYWGGHTQLATVISLLTPEYQERMVQEAYHQVRGHALWPSTFCWPEGFMRRFYPAAVREHQIIATPDMVQISMGVARNFVRYGETIGFWDGEALITWTSNVQRWKSHSQFEYSSRMQSVEIYTAIRDKSGAFVGINQEAIFYDPEALNEPVRIVRNLHKIHQFTDGDETPTVFIECVQTIFSVDGNNSPLTPGKVIQYEMPDMYDRPWNAIWRRYFEKGMSKKDAGEDIFKFD